MSDKQVLVSVVIPVYNRSSIINQSLDSLCNQSFKDFEVLIIDDFSDDSEKLVKVINSYREKLKINYFRHTENKHGSAARNTGIIHSTGNYIALLDSDDFWHEDKIQDCINSYIDDTTVLYSKVKDRGLVYPKREMLSHESIDEYLIVEKGAMQTSSLFMSASLCKSILFDETLKRYQDYDFVIRAQKIHGAKFKLIDKVLVDMSDFDSGKRISNSVDHKPGLFWLEKNLLTDKAKGVFVFNRLANYCAASGNKKEAFKMILKFNCLKYTKYWDYKVVIKLMLPNYFLTKFLGK